MKAVREIPEAPVGIKMSSLPLTRESQQPRQIAGAPGLMHRGLNLRMHKVNKQGLAALKLVKRSGRPTRLTPGILHDLEAHLDK